MVKVHRLTDSSPCTSTLVDGKGSHPCATYISDVTDEDIVGSYENVCI